LLGVAVRFWSVSSVTVALPRLTRVWRPVASMILSGGAVTVGGWFCGV